MRRLVDTHCHLGDTAFDADREAVAARAAAQGVGHVVIVADSIPASERDRTLASTLGFSVTAGVHPHEASSWTPGAAARLRELARHPRVVAIGEAGLDYHYHHSPRDQQRVAFRAQLAIAAEVGKPVVVHARDADADMVPILGEWRGRVPALVLHSFSSGPALFQAGLDAGVYFGFSGMVTFRNWTLGDCVHAVPDDRLLLETDAPYLAPVPHRGKRNEPAFVREIATRVAELRGTTVETVAEQTTANAIRCFGAAVTPSEDATR